MEGNRRWLAITAVAPVAWGANYVVTRQLLPPDALLWGSALRALPAGLVLLVLARRLPHGRQQWGRAAVLGVLNVAGFFALVYASAQLLPSNVASSVMALSPLALTLLAWPMVRERPSTRVLVAGAVGAGAVVVVVGGAGGGIDPIGLAAAGAALLVSSVGALLGKRWSADVPVLASTAWQVTLGGLALTVAAAVQGPPPALDGPAVAGFAFTSLVATALAYVCWFGGLARLPAAHVGAVGLLNPVTGVLLGTLVAGERLGLLQAAGVAVVLGSVLLATRPAVRVPVRGSGRRARRGGTPRDREPSGQGWASGSGLGSSTPRNP